MFKTTITLFAAALALAAIPDASAQTTANTETVRFEWGATHVMPGQEVAINFAFDDHGPLLTVPVVITLDDKNGNTVYQTTVNLTSGRVFTLVVVPRGMLPPDPYRIGDTYVSVDPGRTITPCIKVAYPPDPYTPATNRMTPTLTSIDLMTGRVTTFANNPHMITGPAAVQ